MTLGLPVARGGDPGRQQGLGRHDEALQPGEGTVERGRLGTQDPVGFEVGHQGGEESIDTVDPEGQPGVGGAGGGGGRGHDPC